MGRTQFSLAEAAAVTDGTPGKLETLVRNGIITPKRNEQGTRWLWDRDDLLRAVVALDTIGEGEFNIEAIRQHLSDPEAQERLSTLTQSQRWEEIIFRAQNLGISLEP